jgi:hypothetical protein
MRIKMLRSVGTLDEKFGGDHCGKVEGEVCDCDQAAADKLIKAGLAEETTEPVTVHAKPTAKESKKSG